MQLWQLCDLDAQAWYQLISDYTQDWYQNIYVPYIFHEGFLSSWFPLCFNPVIDIPYAIFYYTAPHYNEGTILKYNALFIVVGGSECLCKGSYPAIIYF